MLFFFFGIHGLIDGVLNSFFSDDLWWTGSGELVAKSDDFAGHQVYLFVSAAKSSETLKGSLDLWNTSTTLSEMHK